MGVFFKQNGKWVDAIKSPTVYGFRINQTVADPYKRVEYTDDAVGMTPMTRSNVGSWATCPLIADIKPVRKYGNVWTDLDKRDLSRSTSGQSMNITSLGYDVFTEVRTWWVSAKTEGDYVYVKFSDTKLDSSFNKLASTWNGQDVGCFHVGSYGGFLSGNKIYSSKGRIPDGLSPIAGRTGCQARGEGYDKYPYFSWVYLVWLYTLLFKTNSPDALGMGISMASGLNSKYSETVYTYDNDLGMGGSTSGLEPMSFLWINNFWGNVTEEVGGVYVNNSGRIMILQNGMKDGSSGYTDCGQVLVTAKHSPLKTINANSDIGIIPTAWGGSKGQNYDANYFGAFKTSDNSFLAVGGSGAESRIYNGAGPYNMMYYRTTNASIGREGTRLAWRAGRPGVEPI